MMLSYDVHTTYIFIEVLSLSILTVKNIVGLNSALKQRRRNLIKDIAHFESIATNVKQ